MRQSERLRIQCLDQFCEGDTAPARNLGEVVLKLNGNWYVGPSYYFGVGIYGATFFWMDGKPISSASEQRLSSIMRRGEGRSVSIEVFLRSQNIPSRPRGYELIKLAEQNDWILHRRTVRPGLVQLTMRDGAGPNGYRMSYQDYYLATAIKDSEGNPPVARCAGEGGDATGGAGFEWQPGIWAGVRMSSDKCKDWPEVYSEIVRVLSLLRRAK